MKKMVLAVLLVLFSALLFCEAVESKYSYATYPVYKILQDKKGYVVMFPRADRSMARAYIPLEWFNPKVGKAKFLEKNKKLASVITIYYKEGQFERVKIVAPMNKSDPIWGMLPKSVESDAKFNQDTLTLE